MKLLLAALVLVLVVGTQAQSPGAPHHDTEKGNGKNPNKDFPPQLKVPNQRDSGRRGVPRVARHVMEAHGGAKQQNHNGGEPNHYKPNGFHKNNNNNNNNN
ncbi:hypothetical protein GN956_G11075 [Arapaima gigas]